MKLRKLWPWLLGSCILLAGLVCFFVIGEGDPPSKTPTLTVETPQKLSVSQKSEFTLDVTVSQLGDALYPAMSIDIGFDASRLEFLGVEEGNLFVLDSKNSTGQQLPQWNYNLKACNDTGRIRMMYLDMTGGTQAFTKKLFTEDHNVVVRLKFRLRGSVIPGDVLELTFLDAVFAASDETQSLAMTTGTLKTRNGRLVIGD